MSSPLSEWLKLKAIVENHNSYYCCDPCQWLESEHQKHLDQMVDADIEDWMEEKHEIEQDVAVNE